MISGLTLTGASPGPGTGISTSSILQIFEGLGFVEIVEHQISIKKQGIAFSGYA
jgi:hypothetical protein